MLHAFTEDPQISELDKKISTLAKRRQVLYSKYLCKISKREGQLKRIEREIKIFLMSHKSLERKASQVSDVTSRLNKLCRERYLLRKKVADRVNNSLADSIIQQFKLASRHKLKQVYNGQEK